MTHLLAIETSGNQLGCAVAGPEGILAANSVSESRKHGELLAPTIQQTITQSKLSPAQLDYIAVDIGPGLYTGLRVGLAAASALAYAWDIPVVGLSSCEILAYGARDFDGAGGGDGIVVPVIDARRGQVFFAAYRSGAAGSGGGDPSGPTELRGAQVGSPDDLTQTLQDLPAEVPKLLVGDLTGGLAESLMANLVSNLETNTDLRSSEISVADLAELALLKLDLPDGGHICAADELRPLYLREPDIGPPARS